MNYTNMRMNRLRQKINSAYLIALIFITPAVMQSCSSTGVQEGPPNILLILVDDMGYGDPRCYNPDSNIPTPAIDQLAAEGMRFTDAHATGPLCHPSRYGLMTGRYPFRTDISIWRHHPTIEEDRLTLPGMLKTAGYRTAMVGKWHLGFLEKGYDNPLKGGPYDRGFDSYFGIRASTDIPPYFYIRNDRAVEPPTDSIEASSTEGWSPIQGEFWRAGGIAPGLELKDVLPRFTREAVSVITSHNEGPDKDKPLMLYLAYPAPHTPWLPSPEFDGVSGAGMYGDFVAMVDTQVRLVLDAIEEQGMTDNTLVIFTSDNGPVWYDDDVERFGHDAAAGLRGMKGDAWEAGHRMPFIVKWPGNIERGTVSDQTICFTDVFATLAEITGTELPEDAAPDSYSFAGVLAGSGNEEIERPPIVMESANGAMMIRSGDWKLINRLGSGGFSHPGRIEPGPGDPEGQLYNLADDPGESTNLYLEKSEVVERLTAEMKEILDAKE
jgi:arylsulfatase A-like enzyme